MNSSSASLGVGSVELSHGPTPKGRTRAGSVTAPPHGVEPVD